MGHTELLICRKLGDFDIGEGGNGGEGLGEE